MTIIVTAQALQKLR